MSRSLPKVYVIGIPGSGKSTLARWIGQEFGIIPRDLDFVAYGADGRERTPEEIAAQIEAIRSATRWVTEGAYHDDWLKPLLDDAHAIAWLDVPLSACLTRIIKRHVRAELGRNNAHPGWRRLVWFLNYTRRTARQQRLETAALLSAYSDKVTRCRSSRDVAIFKQTMIARART